MDGDEAFGTERETDFILDLDLVRGTDVDDEDLGGAVNRIHLRVEEVE